MSIRKSATSDERYPLFVAVAALRAHLQLQQLLPKWDLAPSPDILRDAARFGVRKAMDSMFPGLPRSPFSKDPVEEVVMALRYQYEADPESIQALLESSRREQQSTSTDQSTRYPGSDSSATGAVKAGSGEALPPSSFRPIPRKAHLPWERKSRG